MEKKNSPLVNTCSFAGIRPAMADLPYPPVQAGEKNRTYANLLSVDYCGSVSELSAVTQYINNENRLSLGNCPAAKIFLGIAVAEMMHLQKLGELIVLLGGNIDFIAKYQNGRRWMWTPEHLNIPEQAKKMVLADIEAEKAAISQYRAHIKMIQDKGVTDVLTRIIQDEEYHIMILRSMM